MSDNGELNEMVGDLLSQLSNAKAQVKKAEEESNPLTREKAEQFAIENAGKVVNIGIEMAEHFKESYKAGATDKELEAFSSVLNSITNALDSINKVTTADKRNDNSLKIKQMDIAFKQKMLSGEGGGNNPTLTREQAIKLLEKEAKLVNIEAETEIVDDNESTEH